MASSAVAARVVAAAAHRIAGGAESRAVLTCEHAENTLPARWSWPEADRWLIDTHWAYDLGIAAVTRALAERLTAPAVLCSFSRLLADPNRPPEHPDLIRHTADGRDIHLNQRVSERDREARLALHRGYHRAVDSMVASAPRAMIWSMHSFTPMYEGQPREMEIGVIFDRDEALAATTGQMLEQDGWSVAMNAPYSGREGLMYSADRHALAHERATLELELRQDLLVPGRRFDALLHSVARTIAALSKS